MWTPWVVMGVERLIVSDAAGMITPLLSFVVVF